ncbi:monovalent cation/H(+) antiporter subunit G [Agrococcus carbonis]|uniref:Multisubunit sodium/proton antiporter, MrpG subunit n=1 Tax=Agrococcus carbonis TaxID=684552 RepID=A0A1H1LLY7_9MICO|nr:monovalent cation/H(+) antiporter subunit G [Agrococcus carbonis]SDR75065.1 multisubunit sodium/proton antiporter, MrpG subunit [Agrococcus carbonis]
MTLEGILDIVGAALILLGATFTLTAAIGLVRLPDVLNRMHAASKPQSLGFLLLCAGLAIVLREPGATTVLALAAGMQLVTAPVATQMMGKAAYRTGQFRSDIVVVDDRTPEDQPDDEDLEGGGETR